MVWAEVAASDLKEIIEFIAIYSPANALKMLDMIKQSASNLYTFADRGSIVSKLQDQGINIYRGLICPPWRIAYRISAEDVYVLSVLNSRRNIEDILLKRLVCFK
ncbi:MAG: type II toxin-antitoxin system RelE/ParE family toxin [Thermodesulfobacteriota bacterium]|nr:type II toxin-antitoxin system RelE/ParE family toxin [Thermodesulfobacteriota bacterium]